MLKLAITKVLRQCNLTKNQKLYVIMSNLCPNFEITLEIIMAYTKALMLKVCEALLRLSKTLFLTKVCLGPNKLTLLLVLDNVIS